MLAGRRVHFLAALIFLLLGSVELLLDAVLHGLGLLGFAGLEFGGSGSAGGGINAAAGEKGGEQKRKGEAGRGFLRCRKQVVPISATVIDLARRAVGPERFTSLRVRCRR